MKVLVAIFCTVAPWIVFIFGGYLIPWIASIFGCTLTFTDAAILSGIAYLIREHLWNDAKAEGII